MAVYFSKSEQDTEELGRTLAASLPGGAVIAMYGELGAGKTAFVRGMAKGLGLSCRVSSPTFTIVNEYLGDRELIHFDMYRLSSAALCAQWSGAKMCRTPSLATRSRFASASSRTQSARSPLRGLSYADPCL